MSWGIWNAIASRAAGAFAVEAYFGFGLWFAPGWANGWPCGLTIHMVWSSGMAILLFLLALTSAIGIGAAVASSFSVSKIGREKVWRVYTIWLAMAAVTAIAMSYCAFQRIYSTTLEMWPAGYHPGG